MNPNRALHELVRWWLDVRGFAAVRADVCARARGDVLELGAGGGANLRHYRGLDSLTLLEPDPAAAELARRRIRAHGPSTRVVEDRAESLPFADASFDAVVGTLVMCSVDDPTRALAEIRRVLRPGGAYHFAEHVRSPDPDVASMQDRRCAAWRSCCRGCTPNRDTVASVRAAGFTLDDVRRGRLRGVPSIVRPLAVGAARVPDTGSA